MVRFLCKQRAVTATEYAFMIAVIIVASVVAITAFSDSAIVVIEEVTTTLTAAVDEHLSCGCPRSACDATTTRSETVRGFPTDC